MENISVLILTHNEEFNIGKCIESILPLTSRIFVVDSGSHDRTVEICRENSVQVIQHEWTTYADQFNWGLAHFDFGSNWIMRMDADEEITPKLVAELRHFLQSAKPDVGGVYVRRQVYFLDRWIRYGGYYPTWLLRVFRAGIGRCEQLWMDEHIVLSEGNTIRIHQDIIDKNNKDLTFWTDKHNKYASREVLDILEGRHAPSFASANGIEHSGQVRRKRWIKQKIYNNMPIFVRPFMYFFYRYFLLLGFLDGKEGLIFHFLQGFWYRFLVDAKLYEYQKQHVKKPMD